MSTLTEWLLQWAEAVESDLPEMSKLADCLDEARAALEQVERALTEIVDEGLACPRCDELGREALATLARKPK